MPEPVDPWELAPGAVLAPRRFTAFDLHPGHVPQLSAAAASTTREGLRARIVLLSGRGLGPSEVAAALQVSRQTVHLWRSRYAEHGLAGLEDRPAATTTPVDRRAIVTATLAPPPPALGRAWWSSRALADHLGVGRSTITRAWDDAGVRPIGAGTFRLAASPALTGRIVDVVGLLLAREQQVVAVLLEEADDRGPGRHARREGEAPTGLAPIQLYAALQAATADPGRQARRTPVDLARFTRVVAQAAPPTGRRPPRLCLVAAGPGVETDVLESWAAGHSRRTVHTTADPHAWLDLVESCLRLVESPPERRRTTSCVTPAADLLRDLVAGTEPVPGSFAWIDRGRVAAARPRA